MSLALRAPRGATASASRLAQVQAVPHDFPPHRLPTYPAIERTSTLKFTYNATTVVPATSSRYAMLIRAPVSQLWLSSVARAAPKGAQYYNNSGLNIALPSNTGESVDLSSIFKGDTSYSLNTVDTAIMANYPYAVDRNNDVWFYAPANGTQFGMRLVMSPGVTTGNWGFVFDYSPDLTLQSTTTVIIGSGATGNNIQGFSSTAAGWLRLRSISCGASAGANSTITQVWVGISTEGTFAPANGANLTPFWEPAAVPSELNRAPMVYSNTRATAVAALFQNVTAVLNKEGTVTAGRFPVPETGAFSGAFLATGFDSQQATLAAEERYFGMLEKGFYMFARPDELSSDFFDWTDTATTSKAVVRMDAAAYYYIVKFTDLAGTTGNESNLAITMDTHVEFRNTTALWPTEVSRTPLEEWHRAQVALAAIPCFYENFIHISEIAALARAAAQWATPIVMPYAKTAGKKLIAAAANAAYKKLNAPKQQRKSDNGNGKGKNKPKPPAKAGQR